METTVGDNSTTATVHQNGETNTLDANDNTIGVENNNEITKKLKFDSNPQQRTPTNDTRLSRVVHIRNIPADTQEADLIALSAGFGRVTNCLVLRGKSQAFIEFSDSHSAQQMVNYWLQTTAAGIPPQPTIRGRHVFCQLSNHKELKTNHALNQNNSQSEHLETNGQTSREPTPVLRIVVENAIYPTSLEILHSVFSRAGKVAKIVTFTKNGAFQALIQFDSAREASQAKGLLEGQCLFHSSNVLRIEFSKLISLNVKYNNEKSRDYTQDLDPTLALMQQPIGFPFVGGASALHRALNPLHALNALQSAQGLQQLGLGLGLGNGLTGNPSQSQQLNSSVLLVSNLNESTTTTDSLFTLFGVYGDVIRVKILFNKKDNALIQMAEPSQAHLAQQYLDKIRLFGRVIRVTPSKHQLVQMPKEGQHDAGLTKDFSQSTLHRFKKPGSKNYANIYPPSSTLHLSNIPASIQEEDIRMAFQRETQCVVNGFKFFPKDRKMALIQLQSVDDSIQALIKMHNYQ